MPVAEIEDGVPRPSRRPYFYPWDRMQVGQSIFIAGEQRGLAARAAARSWGKAHGANFTAATLRNEAHEIGTRIWRTA